MGCHQSSSSPALWTHFGNKDVIVALVCQRTAAKVDRGRVVSGQGDIAGRIDGHPRQIVRLIRAEPLRPGNSTTAVESHHEDIVSTPVYQGPAAKVEAARHLAGDDDVVAVDGVDLHTSVVARGAKRLRPDKRPIGGCKFGDENVFATLTREWSTAKVDGTVEESGDQHIAGGVDGDVEAKINKAVAKAL